MKRLLRKPETLVFLFSLWVMLTCNAGYWGTVAASASIDHLPAAFIAAIGLVTLGLISLVMLVLAVGPLTRTVLIVALPVSAAAGYFTNRFGTLIDADMLINVIETSTAEAADLITFPLVATVVLCGLLPALVVWKYPLDPRRAPTAIRDRGIALLLALSMIAGPLFFTQKELVSFARNHREVRHAISPVDAIAASFVLARDTLESPPQFLAVGTDAVHVDAKPEGRLPRVHVLVLGETARAASFSLGGYSRLTNPQLQKRKDVLYETVESCGTATATSLPCMLTQGGRLGFDRNDRRNQDNLLDIAARAGYQVYWVDNGNGCKGLCDRVNHRDVHLDGVDSICSEDECYDEILVHELKKLLADISTDTLIVLHQMGSHGPAYYRRYPDEYRAFESDCRSQNFGDCSNEQIVNAYDNTIVYTDHVLAEAIEALAAESSRLSGSLLYISDHGESLGEHNLYLHGIPYQLAPDEQKKVPMILWFGPREVKRLRSSLHCSRSVGQQSLSHDNLFHTELALLDIKTSAYDAHKDPFFGCRNSQWAVVASTASDRFNQASAGPASSHIGSPQPPAKQAKGYLTTRKFSDHGQI